MSIFASLRTNLKNINNLNQGKMDWEYINEVKMMILYFFLQNNRKALVEIESDFIDLIGEIEQKKSRESNKTFDEQHRCLAMLASMVVDANSGIKP